MPGDKIYIVVYDYGKFQGYWDGTQFNMDIPNAILMFYRQAMDVRYKYKGDIRTIHEAKLRLSGNNIKLWNDV